MVIFNLVDTYFISQLGTLHLAALTFTFPVVLVIQSLAMGLGMGTSALISRAIGEGDQQKVRCMTTSSLVLAVGIVAVFIIAGQLTIDSVFSLVGAGSDTLPLIREYMRIWYWGMLFVVVPMVGNNAIRATGDTKTPGLIMGLAVLVNTLMDWLLIFGIGPFPELGIQGAAVATVMARFSTFTLALIVLARREHMITFRGIRIAWMIRYWKQILYIGLPTAGTRMILPVAAGVITRLISGYGHLAVAGFGVASRVEFFALVPVVALASVLGPFVGQNFGAMKMARVRQGVLISNRFSVFFGLISWAALVLLGRSIGGIFTDESRTVDIVVLYLGIVPSAYALQGITFLSGMTLNVLHQPLKAAAISLIQMFAMYLPLAFLGSRLFGVAGIFGALAVAYAAAGILSLVTVRREIGRMMKMTAHLAADSEPAKGG